MTEVTKQLNGLAIILVREQLLSEAQVHAIQELPSHLVFLIWI